MIYAFIVFIVSYACAYTCALFRLVWLAVYLKIMEEKIKCYIN